MPIACATTHSKVSRASLSTQAAERAPTHQQRDVAHAQLRRKSLDVVLAVALNIRQVLKSRRQRGSRPRDTTRRAAHLGDGDDCCEHGHEASDERDSGAPLQVTGASHYELFDRRGFTARTSNGSCSAERVAW